MTLKRECTEEINVNIENGKLLFNLEYIEKIMNFMNLIQIFIKLNICYYVRLKTKNSQQKMVAYLWGSNKYRMTSCFKHLYSPFFVIFLWKCIINVFCLKDFIFFFKGSTCFMSINLFLHLITKRKYLLYHQLNSKLRAYTSLLNIHSRFPAHFINKYTC